MVAAVLKPESPIVFYDSGSCPWAHRAWLALVEKDLPFEYKVVDLSNKPQFFKDLYASIHPDPEAAAKVPIIIDGDKKMIESAIIPEYLDKKYPNSGTKLLPEDPEELAVVKLFAEVFTAKWPPLVNRILKADTKAAVQEAKEAWEKAVKVIDRFLQQYGSEEGGSFLLGGRYTYADLLATPFVRRAVLTPAAHRGFALRDMVKELGLTRLERWMEAVLQRDSLKKTGPADDVLVASAKKYVAVMKEE